MGKLPPPPPPARRAFPRAEPTVPVGSGATCSLPTGGSLVWRGGGVTVSPRTRVGWGGKDREWPYPARLSTHCSHPLPGAAGRAGEASAPQNSVPGGGSAPSTPRDRGKLAAARGGGGEWGGRAISMTVPARGGREAGREVRGLSPNFLSCRDAGGRGAGRLPPAPGALGETPSPQPARGGGHGTGRDPHRHRSRPPRSRDIPPSPTQPHSAATPSP